MKAYPIWLNILNDTYISDKSFGIKDACQIEINVGSSKSNSNYFGKLTFKKYIKDNEIHFELYFENILIKSQVYEYKQKPTHLVSSSILEQI